MSTSTSSSRGPTVWILAGCFALLPLTLAIIVAHVARLSVRTTLRSARRILRYPIYKSQSPIVLVTGASTPTGLETCRWLYDSGYTVVAADYERVPYTSWMRASRALSAIYTLTDGDSLKGSPGDDVSPASLLAADVIRIVGLEKPVLWIPCGGRANKTAVAAAKIKVERDTRCKVLSPDEETLRQYEDEIRFADAVRKLDTGLAAPESRIVTSRAEVHKALGAWPTKRRFILEKQDVLPLVRSSSLHRPRKSSVTSLASTLTMSSDPDVEIDAEIIKEYEALDALILPSSSMNDTYDRIASIKVSRTEPWLLQELVSGPQFAAHCLVLHNRVAAFAVSLLSSQRTTKVLPDRIALVNRLEGFMHVLAEGLPAGTSTHVNVTFISKEEPAVDGTKQILCPINADFSTPAPTVLYGAKRDRTTSSEVQCMVTTAARLDGRTNGDSGAHFRSRSSRTRFDIFPELAYFSFPVLLLELLLHPLMDLLLLRASGADVVNAWTELVHRVLYEKEELFAWSDAWPWFWCWLVTSPIEVFDELWH